MFYNSIATFLKSQMSLPHYLNNMKIKLAIFYIVFFAVFACSKKGPIEKDEYTRFYYEQTFCSDPWQTGSTDSITLENVAAYLNEHDLYVAGLSIKQTGAAETCYACTCKTGKTIYVSTLNSNSLKEAYISLGFKQQ